MTKYADAILDTINRSYDHLTADQIYTEIKKEYPGVVMATVYNNLKSLVDKGYIRRLSLDDGPDHYDRTVRHDHLICMKCGKITDAYLPDMKDFFEDKLSDKIESYELQLKWICPKCRKSSLENGGEQNDKVEM